MQHKKSCQQSFWDPDIFRTEGNSQVVLKLASAHPRNMIQSMGTGASFNQYNMWRLFSEKAGPGCLAA